jgi:tRNA pseudouridine55 synthase
MNGVLIIDKPEGMTSHDVVQAIRKKFRTSKVGHLGTLDPIATGVLPLCIGKATRIAQFIPGSPKEYEGEIRFGFATDTYDREGLPVTEEAPFRRTPEQILEVMSSLTGSQNQLPPPFSAKKIGGVPAHKFARKNLTVPLATSRVEIDTFEMTNLSGSLMTFRVVCSPGTYVRSLAHDLGQRLGCGAHLTALRRTRSGDFRIEDALELDLVSISNVLPMAHVLESMPRIEVSVEGEIRVAHGNPIPAETAGRFARIFNKSGDLIAVASIENGLACPRVVLT